MFPKNSIKWILIALLSSVAFILAVATFIENDHGSQTAWALIYDAAWFKIIICVILFYVLFMLIYFKVQLKQNWALILFFLAISVIVVGGFITRHIGYEGVMHIREGDVQNQFDSNLAYLQCQLNGDHEMMYWEKPLLLSSISKNRYRRNFQFKEEDHQVALLDFKTNVVQKIQDDMKGPGVVTLQLLSGEEPRQLVLEKFEFTKIGDCYLGFNIPFEDTCAYINIISEKDTLYLKSNQRLEVQNMMGNSKNMFSKGQVVPLEKRTLYGTNVFELALQDFFPNGCVSAVEDEIEGNQDAIQIQFDEQKIWLPGGSGIEGDSRSFCFNHKIVRLKYGAKKYKLPFQMKLNDFILKTYTGSNQPSSFISQVQVIDDEISFAYDIYMNHTLTYRGYRFFQSSYDYDQKGTYLSVKYDPGTPVVYAGYILLIISMLFLLIGKKSPLVQKKSGLKRVSLVLLFAVSAGFLPVQLNAAQNDFVPLESHSQLFGELLVQGIDGRLKPMNTLSHEIVSKVYGDHDFQGLHPNQVILGMVMFPYEWQKIPLIQTGDLQINQWLDLPKSQLYASYGDFFQKDSREYKLEDLSRQASRRLPSERNKLDKALLKVEERLNICYAIYSGRIFRLFPTENNQEQWVTFRDILSTNDAMLVEIQDDLNHYMDAVQSFQWQQADSELQKIIQIQKKHADASLSPSKLRAEIYFYEWQIFEKLMPVYMALGSLVLLIAILSLFNPVLNKSWILYLIDSALSVLLLIHTFGLGLRWYISGHAPWSNGYESMIYLAWTILLAGLIISKKQKFVLGATFLMSGFILLVAHLSWMDPQITQLVPILKSYWLTLHVSVIMSSYGFLTLGAILSWMVLILMIFTSMKNKSTLTSVIYSLTDLIESGLKIGLFCLILGTILGSVWANESWGRYWGWDPKETWTLISVLIYTGLIYYRAQKNQSLYLFHIASVLSIGTILMTYFGVNYYLTGLHSYAGGDSFSIPGWIWIVIAMYLITGIIAFKKRYLVQEGI